MDRYDEIGVLLDEGLNATEVAKRLGLTRTNAVKLTQQVKMRRGELLAHVDPERIRHLYLEEAVSADRIAEEIGCSVIYARRYLQVWGICRDSGYQVRAGAREVWNKGQRNPSARRNRPRAKAYSPEHREKMAAAKRGRFGPLANNWKGGVYLRGGSGYDMVSINGERHYVHRLVAEELLGRELEPGEEVHHIDMVRTNNAPENLLVLMAVNHLRLHRAMSRDAALDQRAWLNQNNIMYEDLKLYAEDRVEA